MTAGPAAASRLWTSWVWTSWVWTSSGAPPGGATLREAIPESLTQSNTAPVVTKSAPGGPRLHAPPVLPVPDGARIPVAGYQPFDDVPELRFDSGPLGLGMWSPFRLWRSVAKRTMQPDRDPAAAPPAGDRAPLPHEDDRCPSTGAFPSSR